MAQPQISNGEDGAAVRGKINKVLRGEFQVEIEYLGSELVTDGDLATDPELSSWTLNDVEWSAGQIVSTYDGGNNPFIEIPITVEAGAHYLLTVNFSAIDGDYVVVEFDNGPIHTSIASTGESVVLYAAPSDGADAIFFFPGEYVTGGTFTITSVSMRKVVDPDEPFSLMDAAGVEHLRVGVYDGAVNIGREAGVNTEDVGYNNVNIGALAGFRLAAAFQNVNVGYKAGFYNLTGSSNVNVGPYAGFWCLLGENTNVGYSAGVGAVGGSTGEKNTNIGSRAGFVISTGQHNTNIGREAGKTITTGNFNICIGSGAQVTDPTGSAQINIGGVFRFDGNNLAGIAVPVSMTGGTPASAGASGVAGTMLWDSDFIYVCVDTNTWKRVAIATWP